MAKKKVRLDEWEANRLNDILKDKTIVTKKGNEGRVIRVTRGGIQVLLPKSKTIRPYPIYDSFISGELRFKDETCQNEMMESIYEAVRSAGITPPAQAVAPTEPCVSRIDVPNNIGIICFFKNVKERRYLDHMRSVGIAGFDESLDDGVRQSPFVALRETEYFLGCSFELLLSSPEELMRCILRESSASPAWRWTESKSELNVDGLPLRSVKCETIDGDRFFFVHVVYLDEDMRNCNAMHATFDKLSWDLNESRALVLRVVEPSQETISDFNKACEGLGRETVSTTTTVKPLSKPMAPTPTPSKNARRKSVRHGNASVGAPVPVNQRESHKISSKQPKPIHVNEFLVRKSYGTHRANGHSLDPVLATVTLLPKAGGDPRSVEFNGYWCPKCRKYFMTEGTYLRLKRQGYICCKVIEEKDLGTKRAGDGLYGNLASESILHMYGYTVNQQDNLSVAERRTIISFVIENRIQTAQDIAHLLEWLISQREGNPRMSVAVSRWRSDLTFVKQYKKPTRTVRVDRIYAKI